VDKAFTNKAVDLCSIQSRDKQKNLKLNLQFCYLTFSIERAVEILCRSEKKICQLVSKNQYLCCF